MAEDKVLIQNPGKGAHIVPGIGPLKPGWNPVAFDAYDKAPIDWKSQPYQVRDPRKKQSPKELTAEEVVGIVEETYDPDLLKQLRDGEKRKSVLGAINHQEKVLTLETQDASSLKAMLEVEKRPKVRDIIEKAIKVARSDS